jgi:metal-responsive CopG/Arc/MetJ family transcriptional regulator
MSRWEQVVKMCCRDLRNYLQYLLSSTKGGVVTAKLSRLIDMSVVELSVGDERRYARCMSHVLRRFRKSTGVYVMRREEVVEVLERFNELCPKPRRVEKPRVGRTRRGRMPTVAIHLPYDLLRVVDEYARERNMSRSEVVRRAIQELLAMREVLEEINKAKDGPLELVSLRLPTSLLNAVNQYVANLRATRSALIRYAVAQMLKRIREEEQAPLVGYA